MTMKTTVLTDIEGTTSAISFVRDVLFPYARRKLPGFVAAHRDDPGVRHWLDVVATEHGAAHLRGANLQERAQMLIEIAHPKFRDELYERAYELGYMIKR